MELRRGRVLPRPQSAGYMDEYGLKVLYVISLPLVLRGCRKYQSQPAHVFCFYYLSL